MCTIFNLKNRIPSISVTCSWNANTGNKTIEDTVVVHLLNDDEEINVEESRDLIDVETTVNFIRPEQHTEVPFVKLQIANYEQIYFSAVTVLCDNKILEIFGDHGIYISTSHGETLEEVDDFSIYEFKIDLLKRIDKDITIKLPKSTDNNTFWIYGIVIKLKKIKTENLASSICFSNVEDLIKDIKLSEPARNCFNYLKHANKYNFTAQQNEKAVKENSLEEVKKYLDYKFQIMTDFLIIREKNMIDKLDYILEYMKSKK